jgi:hypothetical protein
MPYISHFGTKEQIEKFIPRMMAGTCIGAIGMTEPGAGRWGLISSWCLLEFMIGNAIARHNGAFFIIHVIVYVAFLLSPFMNQYSPFSICMCSAVLKGSFAS